VSKNIMSFRFSNNEEYGSVRVKADNKHSFYERYGNINTDAQYCDVSGSEKNCRYVKWMDKTGFIRSGCSYGLSGLTHHMKGTRGTYLQGFDHTTMWRRKGDRWPLFVLTEPYDLPDEECLFTWNDYCIENKVAFKIHEPSELSLWFPNRTYMIFWWCPHFFKMEDSVVLSHDGFDKVKPGLDYDVNQRVQGH
jgi:hypothetical protein